MQPDGDTVKMKKFLTSWFLVLPVVAVISFTVKGPWCRIVCCAFSCQDSSLSWSRTIPYLFLDLMTLQYFRGWQASPLVESPSNWVCPSFPQVSVLVCPLGRGTADSRPQSAPASCHVPSHFPFCLYCPSVALHPGVVWQASPWSSYSLPLAVRSYLEEQYFEVVYTSQSSLHFCIH